MGKTIYFRNRMGKYGKMYERTVGFVILNRIIDNQIKFKGKDYKSDNSDNMRFANESMTGRRKTLKIGLYSIDSSYEISLLSIVMLDKLYNKYKNRCIYVCNKPFSLLKKTYFGHASAYVNKDDMKKLAKLLFYMDESKFEEREELIDKINNMDYIYAYGADKLLGNPTQNAILKLLDWIDASEFYDYIFYDIGDNLDMDSIETLKKCDVIIRGNRKFPGNIDTLALNEEKIIDLIFDEKTESDIAFYASDIDKVSCVNDGDFEYTVQFNNDLEFLINNMIKNEERSKSLVN